MRSMHPVLLKQKRLQVASEGCTVEIRVSKFIRQWIAVYCNRPCLFVFVGPSYYSQRAVFASPLSAFSLSLLSLPLQHSRTTVRVCDPVDVRLFLVKISNYNNVFYPYFIFFLTHFYAPIWRTVVTCYRILYFWMIWGFLCSCKFFFKIESVIKVTKIKPLTLGLIQRFLKKGLLWKSLWRRFSHYAYTFRLKRFKCLQNVR